LKYLKRRTPITAKIFVTNWKAGLEITFYTFFNDEGLPALAETIKTGSKSVIAYDIIRDMKSVLNKTVYDKLIENAFHYAPPYLPVYGFMKEVKKWPALCLTRKEWDPAETKKAFKEFVTANYPNMDADKVIGKIDHYPA
jgi:hypothetical protein